MEKSDYNGVFVALCVVVGIFTIILTIGNNAKKSREATEKQYPIGSQYIISDGKFTVIYCYPDGDVKLVSSTGQETICSSKLLTNPVKVNVEEIKK
jgi:hypothetical protein